VSTAAATGAAAFAAPSSPAALAAHGLAGEHERWLCAAHAGGAPLFVTDFPARLKAFYMRGNDADGGATVAAFDLLVPGIGELAGGSAREERWDVLATKMAAARLLSPGLAAAIASSGGAAAAAAAAADAPPAAADAPGACLDWYLDLRRFGGMPHAGFGLGFERLVQLATATDNIRDVVLAPRAMGSCAM
jgi:asparaginyl-tRNA synthetase